MSFGTRYLRNPALFPEVIAGEPWGDHRLAIQFVGGPYAFSGLNAAQGEMIRRRYPGLLTGEDTPGASAQIFKAADAEFLRFDQRGWILSFDFRHNPHAVKLAGLLVKGRLEISSGLRGGLWTPAGTGEEFCGIFENYLRVLLAYRLMQCGGALIHSAAVSDRDGGAYLFLGRSGAGKTTISMLSRREGLTVLHDDLNAVFRAESGIRITPVPFSGDPNLQTGERRPYPLNAIVRLEKSDANHLEDLDPGETIASLLACSPCVNQDGYRLDAHLANLEALARSVPAYRLAFSLDGGFSELLRKSLVANT